MINCSAWHFFGAAAILTLAVAGCGEQDRGYLIGTVLVNGEPAGPGTITFQPVEAERAGAMAFFGEDGKYEVMSAGREEGAAIGEYRVLIHGGEDFGAEDTAPRPPSKIPPRYSNPRGSDLTVTIEPGTKTVDFDLKP
jgi:hypothetical protein